MDEAFRKTVVAAASQVNPKLSGSCPLSNLVEWILKEEKNRSILVQRLVLYSNAPPAMMHVNQLLSYTDPPADDELSSDASKLDLEKFVSFFTPRLMRDASISTAKSIDINRYLAEEISSIDESEVDDSLRDALLEASEQLEKQFDSLSPFPMELLKKSSSTKASQVSIELHSPSPLRLFWRGCSNQIRTPTSSNLSNSQSQPLIHLDGFSDQGGVAERLIFSVLPHPEATSGSDVFLKCFWDLILRVQSELSTDIPVEAFIAAIEKLPADSEGKLFLTQIMIETSLRDWSRKDDVQAVGMKIKFKVQGTSKKN